MSLDGWIVGEEQFLDDDECPDCGELEEDCICDEDEDEDEEEDEDE